MVASSFQCRAFSQIDGVAQHRDRTTCLQFFENLANSGPLPSSTTTMAHMSLHRSVSTTLATISSKIAGGR
jgi:hypothetical protein